MRKTTIDKFIRHYNGENDFDLALFIRRNWKNYKLWSNKRYEKSMQSAEVL